MSGRKEVHEAELVVMPQAALTEWTKGGMGALIATFDRANAGVAAIIDFGRMALHYQEETGLALSVLFENCHINYRTAMRYISAARAADALLSEGMTELPNSATAILSAAKASDCDRAEELRAKIDAAPQDPAAQEVWRKVTSGETPVGRWRAAYAGLSQTLGAPRKHTNGIVVGDRTLATLRRVWDMWDTMPGADKGKLAEDVAASLFGDEERGWAAAPSAVLEEIVREAALELDRRKATTKRGGKQA